MPNEFLTTVEQLRSLNEAWATVAAGAMALAAGALAYRGAMNSVRTERKRSAELDERRRQNLFLKAEHMAFNLNKTSKLSDLTADLAFSLVESGEPVPGTSPSEKYLLPRPEQLPDLWDNLSEFPAGAIHEIRTITRNFDLAEAYLKRVPMVPDNARSELLTYFYEITTAARLLQVLMTTETAKFCVEVENRLFHIYGSPDDD